MDMISILYSCGSRFPRTPRGDPRTARSHHISSRDRDSAGRILRSARTRVKRRDERKIRQLDRFVPCCRESKRGSLPSASHAPAGNQAREFPTPVETVPNSAAAACPCMFRGQRGTAVRFVHATSWGRFLKSLLFWQVAAAIIGGRRVYGSRAPCLCRASP